MPSRGSTFGTTLTVLVVLVTAAQGGEQLPSSAKSSPLAPRGSIGLVEGLPHDNPPSPALAQLAAESNLWIPCCEPPSPTPGLWGDPGCDTHACSWQERIMQCRDCLGWLCTRPVCHAGIQPSSDASAWDWLMQWMPRVGGNSLNSGGCGSRCNVEGLPVEIAR